MATTPDLHEPQIEAARSAAWHQAGDAAILTLEAARTWLTNYGLVPFAPLGASLGAPMPSLVEATLGTAKATVTLADTEIACTLVARLAGEGSALPLNLLGGPSDLPDFVVSAGAFPFIFTLRGDKGWKRPPETSGAVKVTPLGLRGYGVLAEKGGMTIADIVPEIGHEVTESAIARALSELWQLLRVVPVLQQGKGETLWELTTTRFLKAVKAGSNAGQPSALSALASLYLTQVYVATEEEVAAFLSPLTARSRVRDVLHGLVAGKQLAEGVVNGKTVVYMPDGLPDVAAHVPALEVEAGSNFEGDETAVTTDGPACDGDEAGRKIRRFATGGTGVKERNLRGRPAKLDAVTGRPERPRRDAADSRPYNDRGTREPGRKRPFVARDDRPVHPENRGQRSARRPAADQSSLIKPWNEDRVTRPSRKTVGGADRPFRPRAEGAAGGDRLFRPRVHDRGEGRPPFRQRESSPEGERGPSRFAGMGGNRPQRPFRPKAEGEDRPSRARTENGSARPDRPRPKGEGDHRYRSRPGGSGERSDRTRNEGSENRLFRPGPEGGDRWFRLRTGGAAGEEGYKDRRVSGVSASGGFGGGRPRRSRENGSSKGGGNRLSRRPPFEGATGDGGERQGRRAQDGLGERKGSRPGEAGGFRPDVRRGGLKKGGSKFAGRADPPSRPERMPRPIRPEDEA